MAAKADNGRPGVIMDQNETTNTDCPLYWWDVLGRIGDEAIIAEFALSFLKNSETLILSLKSAINAQSPEQIELYAHALKGSASNIGAVPLAKKAWILEKNASEKNLADMPELFRALEEDYIRLKSLLEKPDWIRQAKQAAEMSVS